MARPARRGVTLVELVVTLAVLAILVALAAPGLQGFVASRAAGGGADDLQAALRAARAEALKRGQSVALCATDDPNASDPDCNGSEDWSKGWLAFVDVAANGTLDAVDTVIRVGHPGGTLGSLTAEGGDDDGVLVFRPNGLSSQVMAFAVLPNLSEDNSSYDAAVRHVCVNVAGRIQQLQGSDKSCDD